MGKKQMLDAVLALPACDLMTATKIDDQIGAGAYYRADTVVRLLAKERERCAAICEAIADEQPMDARNSRGHKRGARVCAEAIRTLT